MIRHENALTDCIVYFCESILYSVFFKDVSVATTDLTGTGGNAGQEAARHELLLEVFRKSSLGQLLASFILFHDRGTAFFEENIILRVLGGFDLLPFGMMTTKLLQVMSLVPLTERGGIDLHNGILNQSLCTNQLIVRSVVDNIDDSRFARNGLSGPAKVALVQTHGSEFDISTTNAYSVDAARTQFGHCGRSTQFKLPLFTIAFTTPTSLASFVNSVARDSHA